MGGWDRKGLDDLPKLALGIVIYLFSNPHFLTCELTLYLFKEGTEGGTSPSFGLCLNT